MKSILVISGSRSDYDLLFPILQNLKKSKKIYLKLAVTGSHLNKGFGLTYKKIIKDNFKIDYKIPILGNKNNLSIVINAISNIIRKDILKIENVNKIFNEEIDTFRGIIANSDYWFDDSFVPNLTDFTNTNKVSFNKLGFSNSLFYKNMLEVLVDELDNKKSVYSDIDDSTNRKEEQRFCLFFNFRF